MHTRTKMLLGFVGILGGAVLLGTSYYLPRWEYIPTEPPKVVLQFVSLVEAGDLHSAYKLTNEGSLVGTSFAAFERNVLREFGISQPPVRRTVKRISQIGKRQTYGNRLRRWLRGESADPEQIGYEVTFDDGGPPLISILLKLDHNGRWRIKYFESHAG